VLIGTAVTVVLVPLLFVGVDRYGAPGVAAMSTLGVAGYTIAIAIAWHRQGSPGEGRQLIRSLVRTAGASLAAAVTAGGLIALASDGGFNLLASSAFAGVVGALVYLGVGRLLNMSELDPLWSRLRSITSRR
jgi:hypothetical protein